MGVLSNIVQVSTFETTLPVSNKVVSYRPFLAKEQRILLQAQMEKDQATVIKNIQQVLNACTNNEIDTLSLGSTDFEWLMIQIRAKSVGSRLELKVTCPHCNESTNVVTTLDNVVITNQENQPANPIQLTDTLFVEMQSPTIKVLMVNKDQDPLAGMAACIKTVINGDQVFHTSELTQEEVIEFVESLTSPMIEQLKAWMDTIPTTKLDLNVTCSKCGKDNSTSITGVLGFLA